MGDTDGTPLMRQYRDIKQAYRDAILFFVSAISMKCFRRTPSKRRNSCQLRSPLATNRATPRSPLRRPHHAATNYIAKLFRAGRTVALCEQSRRSCWPKAWCVEKSSDSYTPGTLVDSEFWLPQNPTSLAAVATCPRAGSPPYSGCAFGHATLGVSTGDFWLCDFRVPHARSALMDELTRLDPKELLCAEGLPDEQQWMTDLPGPRWCTQPAAWFDLDAGRTRLQEHFRVHSLDAFGCHALTLGIQAGAAVLRYVRETQPTASLDHIRQVRVRQQHDAMHFWTASPFAIWNS